ncbi:hypothetical protein AC579_9160 [Pseudocercospora musae]|uniref:Uncharacterized protein n=1 Tax=Pseudocercospora musae TaxID=113226 RepID=A0A139I6X2_9PEZI|nr:hypothetical protein AC579_9160 [Pseudocercospora musae]
MLEPEEDSLSSRVKLHLTSPTWLPLLRKQTKARFRHADTSCYQYFSAPLNWYDSGKQCHLNNPSFDEHLTNLTQSEGTYRQRVVGTARLVVTITFSVLGEYNNNNWLTVISSSSMSPRLPTMTTAGFSPEEANGRPVLRARDRVSRIINISILIPGWVFVAEENCWRWWCGGSGIVTMVGSHGTVPMMISFVIHTWFVLKEMNRRKMNCFSRDGEGDDDECPQM